MGACWGACWGLSGMYHEYFIYVFCIQLYDVYVCTHYYVYVQSGQEVGVCSCMCCPAIVFIAFLTAKADFRRAIGTNVGGSRSASTTTASPWL